MLERKLWSLKIQPVWHKPPLWIAWKVEDRYNAGYPDVDCNFEGIFTKIELKRKPERPSNPDTMLTFSRDKEGNKTILSVQQKRRMLEWRDAGGNCYVFISIERLWYLVPVIDIKNSGMSQREIAEAAVVHGDLTPNSLRHVPEYLIDY